MAIFVLVHGAFHGGWCYSRVASALKAKSHDVYTPTLSGVSDRHHLVNQGINLSTHVQDIVSLIESMDLSDVILCGHSYGGMVITGVAGQIAERIKALVYVDASVPEDGQSLFDIIGQDRAMLFLSASGETGITMPSPGAEYFQVNLKDQAWVDGLCSPHPLACFIQKLVHTGKEGLVRNRTYILAKRFQATNHEAYVKVKDREDWKTVALDCGHDVMIDEPDVLATLLLAEVDR